MITNGRKEARAYLAGLLQAALVGANKPVQALYAYQVGDFQGQSPVVVVYSGGSYRERLTGRGSKATYNLVIQVFVLYTDGTSNWTEANAEDALDDIEAIIGDVIEANVVSQYWSSLTLANTTQTDALEIGGKEYRTEVISVRLA